MKKYLENLVYKIPLPIVIMILILVELFTIIVFGYYHEIFGDGREAYIAWHPVNLYAAYKFRKKYVK